MSSDRRSEVGARGEQIAANHLSRRGMQILERNFRTRWGELDIVALDGRTIVFCEVKTRMASRSHRDPLESVHARKRARVRAIAVRWLAQTPGRPRADELRFDAIGITLAPDGSLLRLDHVEAAF